ncbi:hypothetical protein C7534_12956 [Pseudomonas sp. OV226]|nr:hypothetical protein C7534_12956 [Pseudomonas sp. OV226]
MADNGANNSEGPPIDVLVCASQPAEITQQVFRSRAKTLLDVAHACDSFLRDHSNHH